MTREELIGRICPTDAKCECDSGNCEINCEDCDVLLNAMFDGYEKQIRADAIEEYKKGLQEGEALGIKKIGDFVIRIIQDEGLGDSFPCSKCVYDDGTAGSCCCTDGFLIYLENRIRGFMIDGEKQESNQQI